MKSLSAHIAVINKKGQILLTQRNDVPLWVIPGGHIEKGETPKKAAKRELFEETGFRVKSQKLAARYRSLDKKWCKYLYSGKLHSGQKRISPEVRVIGWFFSHNLPYPMTLYEKRRINDIFLPKKKSLSRVDKLTVSEEIINQSKNPLVFFRLIFALIKNQLFGTRSFKL